MKIILSEAEVFAACIASLKGRVPDSMLPELRCAWVMDHEAPMLPTGEVEIEMEGEDS